MTQFAKKLLLWCALLAAAGAAGGCGEGAPSGPSQEGQTYDAFGDDASSAGAAPCDAAVSQHRQQLEAEGYQQTAGVTVYNPPGPGPGPLTVSHTAYRYELGNQIAYAACSGLLRSPLPAQFRLPFRTIFSNGRVYSFETTDGEASIEMVDFTLDTFGTPKLHLSASVFSGGKRVFDAGYALALNGGVWAEQYVNYDYDGSPRTDSSSFVINGGIVVSASMTPRATGPRKTFVTDLRVKPGVSADYILQAQTGAAAESEQAGYEAGDALDGDYRTMWHQSWSPYAAQPQSITIDLGQAFYVPVGLVYVPRQDGNLNGAITKYDVAVSRDGSSFTKVVAGGVWAPDASTKYQSWSLQAGTARYVRLTALEGVNGHTSAAEIHIVAVSN